jgi:tRNA(adenine34) deaminase
VSSSFRFSFLTMDDFPYMQLAIAEARDAEAADEVPVGAVVVSPTGEVLGRGHNLVVSTSDPTAHAEIVALRAAAKAIGNYRLTGCTLYCTLEPCAMCAGAMVHARIGRLVYSARDPKAGACGSVMSVVNHASLNHRMEVEEGLLAEVCGPMLSEFFRRRRAAQAARAARAAPEADSASDWMTEAMGDGDS